MSWRFSPPRSTFAAIRYDDGQSICPSRISIVMSPRGAHGCGPVAGEAVAVGATDGSSDDVSDASSDDEAPDDAGGDDVESDPQPATNAAATRRPRIGARRERIAALWRPARGPTSTAAPARRPPWAAACSAAAVGQ